MEQADKPQGLILPFTAIPEKPEPAFCHFSQMRPEGEFSWLWFFPSRQQAAALRIMPSLPVNDLLAELVQSTIPRSLPDCPTPTYLQEVDVGYLGSLPLLELGIHEIWIGYDFKKYISDRNPRAATDLVLSAEDFCGVAHR
jgi:hypothetical protein